MDLGEGCLRPVSSIPARAFAAQCATKLKSRDSDSIPVSKPQRSARPLQGAVQGLADSLFKSVKSIKSKENRKDIGRAGERSRREHAPAGIFRSFVAPP